MKLHRTQHSPTCDRDISSAEFWASSFVEREEPFRWLRENAPLQMAPSILELGPPRHTEYRKVLSSAFTPKAVRLLTEKIEQRAEQIVDRVVGSGTFDFVAEVSSKLPMLTIADLVGLPEDKVESFAEVGNNLVALSDPETVRTLPTGVTAQEWANQQVAHLMGLGIELAEARRAHPEDDIMTRLVTAEVGGRKLGNEDIGIMMMLLSVAGNDTTKQTTSHTVVNLARYPAQRDWLLDDFDGRIMGAIEEFVRYSTPVMQFARTATQDVTIRGTEITAGDKVGLFYCSGNRDSTVFPDPETFDITRPPSRHVAFGGGGVHYCIGAGVAKAQLRALFRQILRKLPHLEVGEPEQLTSAGMNAIKRLPVTVGQPSSSSVQ